MASLGTTHVVCRAWQLNVWQKKSDESYFPPFLPSPPWTIALCSAFILVDFFSMLECWSTVKLLAIWRQLNVPEARCALSTYQHGGYVKDTQTSKEETLQKASSSLYRGSEQHWIGLSLAADMLIFLRNKGERSFLSQYRSRMKWRKLYNLK